jgi:hypothetical protein
VSRQVLLIAAGAAFIIFRCVTMMPHDFATDEQRSLGAALLTFDPYGHQPPPPAYPAYVAAAKFLFFFVRRPLATLLILSVASAVAGFVLFSRAIGVVPAFLIYLAPPIRYLCSNATPEPLALALFAAAIFLMNPIGGGQPPSAVRFRWTAGGGCPPPAVTVTLLLALSVGVRPQMFLAVLAFVLVARLRVWVFLAVLAICFIPVLQNIGFDRISLFAASIEFGHGAPIRDFLLQPWWKATPVFLLLAAYGIVRSRQWPLAAFTVVHLIYAATLGASNESVRPYVPALCGIAFFAVAALLYHWPRAAAYDLADRADVQRGSEH